MSTLAVPRSRTILAALAFTTLGCGSTNIVKQPPPPTMSGPSEDGGMHGGGFGDGGKSQAADPECDMTGLWALRMTTFAHGTVDTLGANWYYLELAQDGEQVEVLDHFDCGIWVDAGFAVRSSEKLNKVLIKHNLQKGRRGTMKRAGDRCDFWLNRFWSVRGANEDAYLPDGHHDPRDVKDLKKIAPLPTEAKPAGNEDWEDDNHPGITMLVGNDGARYSVQRDWLEWFTCNGNGVNETLCKDTDPDTYGLKASAERSTFIIRADFNNEDSVLDASDDIYKAAGEPVRSGVNNRVAFHLLGRTRTVGEAEAFWALPDDTARCNKVRELLPAELKDSAPP